MVFSSCVIKEGIDRIGICIGEGVLILLGKQGIDVGLIDLSQGFLLFFAEILLLFLEILLLQHLFIDLEIILQIQIGLDLSLEELLTQNFKPLLQGFPLSFNYGLSMVSDELYNPVHSGKGVVKNHKVGFDFFVLNIALHLVKPETLKKLGQRFQCFKVFHDVAEIFLVHSSCLGVIR